ncbi:hypothetical protein [Anoxybacteroides tepidamans]|uniref:hypothetical protein n=1 Tax=Anoxybacteroides tepidamans TaxID=265948 RepID=UPI0006840E48|nr:hypothetical protein [Anoxybacillus tepidamans]
MNVYRPTVRYAPIFRDYVDAVFRATTLDRNQIIRAALFTAAHAKEFQAILKQYQKKDVPLPSPLWEVSDHQLWLEQCPETGKGGDDVNVDSTRGRETATTSEHAAGSRLLQQNVPSTNRRVKSPSRREGEIPAEQRGPIRLRETGGIVIRFE